MTNSNGQKANKHVLLSQIILIPLLTLITSIFLTGCEDQTKVAAHEANATMLSLISRVKTVQSPWKAFKELSEVEAEITSKVKLCRLDGHCEKVPALETASTLRIELLKAAIKENPSNALAVLYGQYDKKYHVLWRNEYQPLKESSVANLLKYVDKHKGTPTEDGPLLLAAGNLYSSGEAVMKDTSKAVAYYAQAWSAGQKQAANSAAEMFLKINDIRNAYMWSLRCIDTCNRSYELHLEALQESLTPAAARQVQKAAAISSVIELDTSEN
jgi:hypothetical protein